MAKKDYPNHEGQESPSQADEAQSITAQAAIPEGEAAPHARGSQQPASHDSEKQQILKTLAEIAADFKAQLEGQQPKPFNENALKAVTTFNDIVSGLQSRFVLVPALLEAKRDSASQVSLTWTDETTNVDGYRVERCEGRECKNFSGLKQLSSDIKEYKDTTVDNKTTYRYRVIAFNSTIGEWPSNTIVINPTN